jgi:hypothetical protein
VEISARGKRKVIIENGEWKIEMGRARGRR